MRSRVIRGCGTLGLPVLLATNGCATAGYEGSVKSAFVGAESCPAERVTVERTTRPSWLTAPPPPPVPPPPPEVVGDPARLKVYNDEHAPPPDPHADSTFWVGKGCDHADVYECTRVPDSRGWLHVLCSAITPPTR
jgi:hypothetical protein